MHPSRRRGRRVRMRIQRENNAVFVFSSYLIFLGDSAVAFEFNH
jgi:hypothetical protein